MDDIARKQLRFILARYRRAILDDPKRFEGLLRDLCPNCRREIHLLTSVLKENIVADLLAFGDTAPQSVLVEKYSERLYDNLGIARELGRWAVLSWALALRVFPQRDAPAFGDGRKETAKTGGRFYTFQRQIKLRVRSLTVSENDARQVFFLNDNWRPVRYIRSDFHVNGSAAVSDRMTRLAWQSGGSGYLPYEKIYEYIQAVNEQKMAGFSDWRLPTLEELSSILEPDCQPGGLFLSPWFNRQQSWCWSADLRSAGGAWSVDFETGRIVFNCIACFVKLVRTF